MSDIKHKFFIKYGLRKEPTDQQISQWKSIVNTLINQGYQGEQAGNMAAQQVFPDYNSMVYASEADTIKALLDAVKNRR